MGEILIGLKFTMNIITFIILISGYYCIVKYTAKNVENKAFAQLLFLSALLDFIGVISNIPSIYNVNFFYPIKLSVSLIFITALIDYYYSISLSDWFSLKRKLIFNKITYYVLLTYFIIVLVVIFHSLEFTRYLYSVFNNLLISLLMFYFACLISVMLSLRSAQKIFLSKQADKSNQVNRRWIDLNTGMLFLLSICYSVYLTDQIGWAELIVQVIVLIIFMVLINNNLFSGTYKANNLLFLGIDSRKGLLWHSIALEVVNKNEFKCEYKEYYFLLDEFKSNKCYLLADCSLDSMYQFFERKYDKRFLADLIYEKEQVYFLAYIQKLRIEKAVALIKSVDDLSLKEIAFKTGFSSQAAFSRSFSSLMGVSPSEFKSRIRN